MKLLPQYKRIVGRELSLAKQICGLTNGNDPQRHQPCPFCNDYDSFYFLKGDAGRTARFHCQQCGFSGCLFDLICKLQNKEWAEAYAIVSKVIDSRKRPKKPVVGMKRGKPAPGTARKRKQQKKVKIKSTPSLW